MNVFDLVASISLDVSQYNSGLENAKHKMTLFGQGLAGTVGGIAGTLGKVALSGVAAATTAVVAFGKSSLSVGMQFDQAMSGVAATLGKTVDEMNAEVLQGADGWTGTLREFAQKLGSETAFTATQAAQALNYMALAGYTAQQSVDMLPTVLNLASAGGMDLARASDMVTDAQSALGLSFEDTTGLVNKMALAASKTNTSVEQLGDAILTVGGTAKNMSGGTTELVEVLGLLADNGIKGSEGGTHLRNMLLKLASPTKDGTKALQALNLSIFDADGNMRSFSDIFQDMNAALSQFTQEERLKMISDMFNARDIASVEALLGTSAERWAELAGNIDAAGTAADNMANTKLDNLSGDITIFQSALEGARIALADRLTPTLRLFVQQATKGVSEVTKAFQKDGLEGAMKALGTWLANLSVEIAKYVPSMISAGASLLSGLIEGLVASGPQLVDAFGRIAYSAATAFVGLINQLITPGINGLIDDINTILGTNIPHIPDITLPTWEEITGKENLETIKEEVETELSDIPAEVEIEPTVPGELPRKAEEGLGGVITKANTFIEDKVKIEDVGVAPDAGKGTEGAINQIAEDANATLNDGKVAVKEVGVSPEASGNLENSLGGVVTSANTYLNTGAGKIAVREIAVDSSASESVNEGMQGVVDSANATLNGAEGTAPVTLENIGVDISPLQAKREEIVNSLKDFWRGPEGIWTKTQEFFKMPADLQNGLNSIVDFFNQFFGTSINHVGEYDVDDVLGGIEKSEDDAMSIIEYMEQIEQKYGDNATHTTEWILALQELEKYVPGISEALAAENAAVGESTEVLKAHTRAWYDDMKAQALAAAKKDYADRLADAAKGKATADIQMNIASNEMDAQRNVLLGLIESAKQLGKEVNGVRATEVYMNDMLAEYGITDLGSASTQDLYGFISDYADTRELWEALGGRIGSGNEANDKATASEWADDARSQLESYEAAWQAYLDAQEAQKLAQTQYEDASKSYEEFSAAIEAAMDSAMNSTATATDEVEGLKSSIGGLTDKDIYIRAHITKGVDGNFSAEDLLNLKHIEGSFASGLNYVPYDGYLAELHRGEAVLNAADADSYRGGDTGGGLSGLAAEIGNAVKSALEGVGIYMGTERVADLVTERVSQNIADEARERRYA